MRKAYQNITIEEINDEKKNEEILRMKEIITEKWTPKKQEQCKTMNYNASEYTHWS